MFETLKNLNIRPQPFEFYTADQLWTDDHISERMLAYHLDEEGDLSSRNAVFIDQSVDWMASYFCIAESTRIADFGCGPGLYTTRLARKQAQVTGVDFSKRSIN